MSTHFEAADLRIDRSRRSPNYNARPDGCKIDTIILHSCEGTSADGTLSWLCSTRSRVSYHYYVDRAGLIYEVVAPEHRAWHVAAHGYNDRAIGVSMHHKHGNASGEYTRQQLDSTIRLCRALVAAYGIAQRNIAAHRWVQPWNKADPTDMPDDQLKRWIASIFSLSASDASEEKPLAGTYETVQGAVVRSAPAIGHDNIVMYPNAGAWLQIGQWVHGQTVARSDLWGHLASEEGFVHISGLGQRIGD